MAQQGRVDVSANTWTQVTNGDVTNITFQCFANAPVFIKATAGAVAPTSTEGALRYQSGYGEVDKSIASLFSGVTSPTRVYAYCEAVAQIEVGHA